MGIALVVLLVGGGYLYLKLDDEITRYARSFLSEHYSHLDVRVESARYVPGSGIVVQRLTISEPQAGADSRPLLAIKELRLLGAIDSASFQTRRPRIDRIEVLRPHLTATKRTDGRWNLERLLPLPGGAGGDNPPVLIHDAALVLSDEAKPNSQPLVLRNVGLELRQQPLGPDAPPGVRRVEFKGRAEDSLAKLIEVEGAADTDGGRLDLHVNVEQLGVTTERLQMIPSMPTMLLAGLDVDGKFDADATLKRLTPISPIDWRCDFCLKQANLSHPLVAKPMSDVRITGDADNAGLRVHEARADSGQTELTGALNVLGWGPEARAAGKIDARRVMLDADIYNALPGSLQRAWSRFDPHGEVDAEIDLWAAGGRVWSDVRLQGRGLSFEDTRRFPYRVTGGTGSLRFIDTKIREESRLVISIDAQAEGRPVHLEGEFRGLPLPPERDGECPVGYFRVTANNVRVTERLMAALPDRARGPLSKLNPEGDFGVTWMMRRDSLEQPGPTFAMDMLVHRGSLRLDHFPYPLRGVRGKVQQRGKQWSFSEFTSRDDSGLMIVNASGTFDEAASRPHLHMDLTAHGVPLDDTLRNALTRDMQAAWLSLQPSGRIDFESRIDYSHGDAQPTVWLKVSPQGDTVSLLPQFFPFRLERVQGEFIASGRDIEFHGARAKHDQTRVFADGQFVSRQEGGWSFALRNLGVVQLDVNENFRAAAPLGLRRVIDRLEPEGGLSVHHGILNFSQAAPNQPLQASWDLQVYCQQLDVNAGVPIEDLYGMVRIVGSGSGDQGVSSGDLQLESLVWNGMQLTNITGPLYCDSRECLIGRGAAYKMQAQQRPVMAQAYGGVAALDARATFGIRPSYAMDVTLDAVDLARLNSDYLHYSASLSGKLNGSVQLQGTGNSIFGLTGAGELTATGANIYELSPVVALLKVLRNRVPDSTAFNEVQTKFTLQGEHLTFEQIDLLGDAISLYGRGDASLDRQVNLVFHTMVGRNSLVAPVLRTLVGQASEQILKLKVTGPIEDAVVTREVAPLLSNAIGQLQEDLRPAPLTQPAQVPTAAAQRR